MIFTKPKPMNQNFNVKVIKLTDENLMRKACELTFLGTNNQSLPMYKSEHSFQRLIDQRKFGESQSIGERNCSINGFCESALPQLLSHATIVA